MYVVTLHCRSGRFSGISSYLYLSMSYAVASKLLCRFYEVKLYHFWQVCVGEHQLLSGIKGLTVACWWFMVVLVLTVTHTLEWSR